MRHQRAVDWVTATAWPAASAVGCGGGGGGMLSFWRVFD